MKFDNIETVVWIQITTQNSYENAAPFRPLLDLIFVCIMNRSKYSIIGKVVITVFQTSMNL